MTLAFFGQRELQQQIGQHQAAGRQGQRDGHVDHGPLGGGHLGLAHHGHAVGDGFDAGVGAGAERIGIEQAGRSCPNRPMLGSAMLAANFVGHVCETRRRCAPMCRPMAPTIRIACVTRKVRKIGNRIVTDSLTPRRFEHDQEHDRRRFPAAASRPASRGPARPSRASPAAAIDTVTVST